MNFNGAQRGFSVFDSQSQSHIPTGSVAVSLLLGWLAPVLGLFSQIPPWATQMIVGIVTAPIAAALAVLAKRWASRYADQLFGTVPKRKPGDTDD